MTTMTYRGFEYVPATSAANKRAQPMMYRGVAHDGLSSKPCRTATVAMVYRGVPYLKTLNGNIVLPDPAETGYFNDAVAVS